MSNPGSSLNLSHSRWANTSTRQPYQLALPTQHNLKGSISNPTLPHHHHDQPQPYPHPPQPTPTNHNYSHEHTTSQPRSQHLIKPPLHPPYPPLPDHPTHSRSSSTAQAYTLFTTHLRRLKWKSSLLMHSYTLATHPNPSLAASCRITPTHSFPITSTSGRPNAATLMFKSDFFEFYFLLERTLLSLLAIFGIIITADGTEGDVAAPPSTEMNKSVHATSRSIIGDRKTFIGAHRFHANVLAALDDTSNPVHDILGVGKVRDYLGVAKEFRNRWKEVQSEQRERSEWGQQGERSTGNRDGDDEFAGMHRRYARVLEELRLDEMLVVLLTGLERARGVAGGYLAGMNVDVDMAGLEDGDGDEEVDAAGGVEDTMDWD